jgi:RNAse (barnase) inhibitor barstar
MKRFEIDCVGITTQQAFWRAYLTQVQPEGAGYFGCNLDAFWDALHGGPGWPGPCVLRLVHAKQLLAHEGAFVQALREAVAQVTEITLEVD